MFTSVSDLKGLHLLPSSDRGVQKWIKAQGIPVKMGGKRWQVSVAALPPDVRRAWELRQIEAEGLPAGEYDDAAHELFAAATPKMQALALRKAEIARFLTAGGAVAGRGLSGSLIAATRSKFGQEGTKKNQPFAHSAHG